MKLTKSLPVIKERNCSVSLVLDCRTQRKNATEFPLAIRFTIDRKFFYHQVGGSYSEKRFSDICTAPVAMANKPFCLLFFQFSNAVFWYSRGPCG